MDYSTLGGNLFVCLMGMGTVFFGLICLIALTTLMGKVIPAAPPAPVPAAASIPAAAPTTPSAPQPESDALIAAVSAAVAEDLNTDITGIRILSLKRL